MLQGVQAEADEGFELEGAVLAPGDLHGWLHEHASTGQRVGVSIAGTWGRGTGVVVGVALAAADGAAAYVDPTQLTEDDERALTAWLADPDQPKALHDVKGPLLAFAERSWPPDGVTNDTALAAYLALPGQRSFDLADLALRYLRRELRAEGAAETGQLSLDGSTESDAAEAEMVRARAIVDLADSLQP